MPKFFVSEKEENIIKIVNSDVNHIKNVLRKKIGDEIEVCDGTTGQDYLCVIEEITDQKIVCVIKEEINESSESNIKITVFQGLPKADKMELIIQKSVELGAYEITPVEMKRCVVQLKEKDKVKKIERWQKISEVAAKQSGRNIIPKINSIISIKEICNEFLNFDLIILAYENEKENTLKNVLKSLKVKENINIGIIIGPEGGFDEHEVESLKQYGAKIITLGKRILRTETAALNMISVILYELEG